MNILVQASLVRFSRISPRWGTAGEYIHTFSLGRKYHTFFLVMSVYVSTICVWDFPLFHVLTKHTESSECKMFADLVDEAGIQLQNIQNITAIIFSFLWEILCISYTKGEEKNLMNPHIPIACFTSSQLRAKLISITPNSLSTRSLWGKSQALFYSSVLKLYMFLGVLMYLLKNRKLYFFNIKMFTNYCNLCFCVFFRKSFPIPIISSGALSHLGL